MLWVSLVVAFLGLGFALPLTRDGYGSRVALMGRWNRARRRLGDCQYRLSTGLGLVALVSGDQAILKVYVCVWGLIRRTPGKVCRDGSSETNGDSPIEGAASKIL